MIHEDMLRAVAELHACCETLNTIGGMGFGIGGDETIHININEDVIGPVDDARHRLECILIDHKVIARHTSISACERTCRLHGPFELSDDDG